MSDASMSGEYDGSHETGDHSLQSNVSKQEDNYLPIAKIDQVMKRGVPANGKIARDAKEAVQECVSEFVSFITSEANDKCLSENRRTIDGDDILWAMANLGYEDYINPLKLYLNRYREMEGEKFSIGSMENSGRQTKKQRLVGNMNDGSEGRLWEDLDKDCLLTIYHKLELKDLLSGAPLCCSSWYKLSKDPSLWRHVNLYGFNLHKGKLVSPSQLVEFVVFRSEGSLTSITFPYHASVDDLLLVAERCPRLKHFSLRIPVSQTVLDKKTIFKAISKLQELEGMDVQDAFLSDFALRRIYRCCPNFTKLKVFDTLSNETASLIATLLPKLKTLDLSGTMPHRKNVLAILKGCEELESLDLTGCGKIYGSDEILKIGCKRLKEFKWDDKYNSSCSRCEEECNSDTEVCYEWPCVHVMDNGWSTYIDGTYELMDELHPPNDDGSDEHLPFVPDPPFAEEPSDCYCECG